MKAYIASYVACLARHSRGQCLQHELINMHLHATSYDTLPGFLAELHLATAVLEHLLVNGICESMVVTVELGDAALVRSRPEIIASVLRASHLRHTLLAPARRWRRRSTATRAGDRPCYSPRSRPSRTRTQATRSGDATSARTTGSFS